MKTHTTQGSAAIELAERQLGVKVDFCPVPRKSPARTTKKWDGSGYPDGLAGDAIPLSAGVMAVADVYDALICRRMHREGMPHGKAMQIMREGRGSSFDPEILDVFVEIAERIPGDCRALCRH